MLKPESKQAVSNFFAAAETEFNAFLKARSPEEYEAAAQLILDSQAKGGRLHVTGIGKCSHVSTYAASLFSSTGNPAYYLHGTEAVHGSCGQLAAGDVVIAISNSGETGELKATVLAELLTLQALSVALQVEKDWDPVKYVRCHPGGKLGQLRDNEKK